MANFLLSERVSAGQSGRCGVARTGQITSAKNALPAIRVAGVLAAHGSFSHAARYRTQDHPDREKSEHSSKNSGLMGVQFHLHIYELSVSTSTSAARPCAGVQVAHGNFSPTARYRTQNHSDREKSEPSSINNGLMGVHFTLLSLVHIWCVDFCGIDRNMCACCRWAAPPTCQILCSNCLPQSEK